jgi:hypothetical protein
MPGAQIAIDQDRPGPSVSTGTPGYGRDDLWLGRATHPRSVNTATLYEWTLLDKPPGSAAVLTNDTSQICTITPDLAGSYRLQLVIDGGGLSNTQIKILGCVKDINGVEVNSGWRVPALGEEPEEANFGGQLRGWDEAMRFIFDDLLLWAPGLLMQEATVAKGQQRTVNVIGATVFENVPQNRFDVTIPIPFHELQLSSESDSSSIIYVRQGAKIINLANYPATVGPLTRRIRFAVILENSLHSAAFNAEARLFDYTHAVPVTGTTLDNSGAVDRSVTTEYQSGILTVGSGAGDIRSDAPALYIVQFRAVGAPTPPLEKAILGAALLRISYE